MMNPSSHTLRVLSPLSLALTTLLATGIVQQANAQDLLAIKAGKVHTVTGAPLDNAVILVENGRITSVGTDVEVPWNATVIDASEQVVMPTWVVAHNTAGFYRGGSTERMQNVPFLSVADGLDPANAFFEEALRNGVGTIQILPGDATLLGGVGMVVRPIGATVEDMSVRDRSGIKLSLMASGGSRVAQIRKLRRAFDDALEAKAELERKRKEFEQEKAVGATEKEKFGEKLDDGKQVINDLLEGKLRGYLYVPSAAEVAEVARMKQKHADLDLVLVVGRDCYKAARQLAALEVPVILEPDAIEFYETHPVTEEESLVSPAKILNDAGVDLVLSISESGSSPQRFPWWQVASAIRNGVLQENAIRALTIEPAKILGLDSEFGSIEVGKVANLQILTGDPLAATTWVDKVVLEGEIAYDRSQDRRLKHLFGKDGND